jgi:hypothetical protein
VPLGEGMPPLGLALLARPKTDQRLAEVAGEVAPMLQAFIQEKVPAFTPRAERSSPKPAEGAPSPSPSPDVTACPSVNKTIRAGGGQ